MLTSIIQRNFRDVSYIPSAQDAQRNKEKNLPSEHPYSATAAKSLQSCPTLCDPIDGSPPGGILQARILEWVAISFSNA